MNISNMKYKKYFTNFCNVVYDHCVHVMFDSSKFTEDILVICSEIAFNTGPMVNPLYSTIAKKE